MKSVKIEFTQEELHGLGQLLDIAVKASGLAGAKAAMPILAKLEAAVAHANAAPASSSLCDTEKAA
jgi:hypothetical protein